MSTLSVSPTPECVKAPHRPIPDSRFPIPGRPLLAIALLIYVCTLFAGCQGPATPIQISEAWAPATPPTAQVGAAYMHIEATRSDTLLEASSPAASITEVHETTHEGGLMKMRKVGPLAVAPGQPIALQPGGMHFMLIGLAFPLEAPARFPITLRFEHAGEIEVEVEVVAATAGDSHH